MREFSNGRSGIRRILKANVKLGSQLWHSSMLLEESLAVLQIANGEGRCGGQPANTSCGDAVNLVDEPDLPDNIALG
jgi:hypothetical protein